MTKDVKTDRFELLSLELVKELLICSIMVCVIPFFSYVAELSQWFGTQILTVGEDLSAQTRQVQINSPHLYPLTSAHTTECNLLSLV